MTAQQLIERYGRLNRLLGDYRSGCEHSRVGSGDYIGYSDCLQSVKERMAPIEDQLEDMGLLNASDRYTHRGEA